MKQEINATQLFFTSTVGLNVEAMYWEQDFASEAKKSKI